MHEHFFPCETVDGGCFAFAPLVGSNLFCQRTSQLGESTCHMPISYRFILLETSAAGLPGNYLKPPRTPKQLLSSPARLVSATGHQTASHVPCCGPPALLWRLDGAASQHLVRHRTNWPCGVPRPRALQSTHPISQTVFLTERRLFRRARRRHTEGAGWTS